MRQAVAVVVASESRIGLIVRRDVAIEHRVSVFQPSGNVSSPEGEVFPFLL
jgi:hypothetical protein